MTSPCFGCQPPTRCAGCHSTCERYGEYRLALDLRADVRALNKAASPWHLAVERMIDRRRRKTQVRNAGRP